MEVIKTYLIRYDLVWGKLYQTATGWVVDHSIIGDVMQISDAKAQELLAAQVQG